MDKEHCPATYMFDSPWGNIKGSKVSNEAPWIVKTPWGNLLLYGTVEEVQNKLSYNYDEE